MATKTRKATTVADLIAAASLGTIDPSTEVMTAADAAKVARKAAETATHDATAATVATAAQVGPSPVTLDATEHQCGIPGCRHGAAHGATVQPDRQVKLACPTCGAVARMTAGAIRKAGGYPTCADGGTFAESARRTYVRR